MILLATGPSSRGFCRATMDGLKTHTHLLSCRWSLVNSSTHFFSAFNWYSKLERRPFISRSILSYSRALSFSSRSRSVPSSSSRSFFRRALRLLHLRRAFSISFCFCRISLVRSCSSLPSCSTSFSCTFAAEAGFGREAGLEGSDRPTSIVGSPSSSVEAGSGKPSGGARPSRIMKASAPGRARNTRRLRGADGALATPWSACRLASFDTGPKSSSSSSLAISSSRNVWWSEPSDRRNWTRPRWKHQP
mmetsp:Transcript_38796/g.100286  ORF Transcript_38796/g.100286 Transcript_38796/m.100286 type:complete len:248 (+) Transcript_38796:487-1230(+)